jgi:hypothetical protein
MAAHDLLGLDIKLVVAVHAGNVLAFFRCCGASRNVNLLVDFEVWILNGHLRVDMKRPEPRGSGPAQHGFSAIDGLLFFHASVHPHWPWWQLSAS